MRAWRLTVGAALALVLAGCASTAAGADQHSAAPAPIPSDPAAAIAAAKARFGSESARFGRDTPFDQLDFTGVVNAKTKSWQITGRNYVLRRVGTSLYLQASGPALTYAALPPDTVNRLDAGAWVHTRIPYGGELSELFNDDFPWSMANPATRATHLTSTGGRSYAGTMTVNKTKLGVPTGGRETLKVTVDLDEHGRFAKIVTYTDPKAPDQRLISTFSDFGVKADITPPPSGDVLEEDNPAFLSGIVPY